MGTHRNDQLFHRRVAALRQRRLSPEQEAAKLKELVARFSPTFVWTATLTDNIPTPTLDAPVTTTAALDDDDHGNGNGHGHGHDQDQTTADTPTPTPEPATIPTVPVTSSASPTTSPVTPTPVTQTTDAAPTSTSVVVVQAPVTTSTPTAGATKPSSIAVTSGTATPLTSASRTITSSAASATQTESSGSGTNVGGIIGGLAGALIGIAALVFVVRFLMNRQRKRNDEMSAAAFNATDFRRSAVLMEDPPTHDELGNHGFNPRPPTMIERRLASPAPTFGAQYGAQAMATPDYDHGYNQFQAYPSQMDDSQYPNMAYPNPLYTQSPYSPIATPTSAVHNEEIHQAAVLTRQPSNAVPYANGPVGYPSEDPNYGGYVVPNQSEYVDLDRSSVPPFQATQYVDIPQPLNPVLSGIETPAVNAVIQNSNYNETVHPVMNNMTSTSPFSDPIDPVPGQLSYPGEPSPRPSTDSVSRQIDDFPVPPSPVHSNVSRIESIPPMLPEIHVESRPSSYTFTAPNNASRDYHKSPLANQLPATPSPLASSVDVSIPPPAATSIPNAAPPTLRQSNIETPAKRPDTVYDDDDAYGGI